MRRDKHFTRKLKPKTSLSVKLTAYFVLFGLIIGYSTFIFTSIHNGRQILQEFSRSVIGGISDAEPEDYKFDIATFPDLLKNALMEIDRMDLPVQKVQAFIQNDGSWEKYSFIDREIISQPVDIFQGSPILRALEEDIVFQTPTFIGKSNITTIFFNIPLPEPQKIIIRADVSIKGIKAVIKSNTTKFLGILLIYVFASFALGKIFALSVTRPLRQLSERAEKIAGGDSSINLFIKRRDEIGVLSRTLTRMNEELNERLKAMEIMNRIDKAVLSSISRNDLLNRVIGFVCDYIDKSTAVMAMRDDKGCGFELISAVRNSGTAVLIENPYIPDELLGRDTLEGFHQACVFSNDHNLTEVLIKQLSLPKKTKRFYNVPLFLKEEYIGSLLIIKDDQLPFSNEQQMTLRKLGDQVGVAMQSVISVEENNSLQIGSIQALSRSIDAKSRWTAGHSERVAELSELLGISIGMSEMDIRRLVISALLHDIGKIGISENILDKPGRLTDKEFDIIKQHPDLGFEISRNIPNYEDICDGIRYHHERWNGSGYPEGLKEKEIPLFGRIIAIADVFDALSADRPYRDGMDFEECIRFIDEKKGSDFDGELAEVFLEAVKSSNKYLNNYSGGFKL